jgi:hypothetical protein
VIGHHQLFTRTGDGREQLAALVGERVSIFRLGCSLNPGFKVGEEHCSDSDALPADKITVKATIFGSGDILTDAPGNLSERFSPHQSIGSHYPIFVRVAEMVR